MWDDWQKQYKAQYKTKNVEIIIELGLFILQANYGKDK